MKSPVGLPCTSHNPQARGQTGLMCPPETSKGSDLRFGPWRARSLGLGPSYHNRFCRTRFRVIYVSKEEPVKVNLSTRQRLGMAPPPLTWLDSAARWTPRGLAPATHRGPQLFASSIHWQAGRGGHLVPSQAVPQGLPVGRIRANCVMEARPKKSQVQTC